MLCAPRKIGARAFQWLSSLPCSCAGAGRSNAAFWNKGRSTVSMESSGDMSPQRVCCGGLSSPAVTSLRCAQPARDEDVEVILVGFQGDGDERSGHPSQYANKQLALDLKIKCYSNENKLNIQNIIRQVHFRHFVLEYFSKVQAPCLIHCKIHLKYEYENERVHIIYTYHIWVLYGVFEQINTVHEHVILKT